MFNSILSSEMIASLIVMGGGMTDCQIFLHPAAPLMDARARMLDRFGQGASGSGRYGAK